LPLITSATVAVGSGGGVERQHLTAALDRRRADGELELVAGGQLHPRLTVELDLAVAEQELALAFEVGGTDLDQDALVVTLATEPDDRSGMNAHAEALADRQPRRLGVGLHRVAEIEPRADHRLGPRRFGGRLLGVGAGFDQHRDRRRFVAARRHRRRRDHAGQRGPEAGTAAVRWAAKNHGLRRSMFTIATPFSSTVYCRFCGAKPGDEIVTS
jgi:hypothetical protein